MTFLFKRVLSLLRSEEPVVLEGIVPFVHMTSDYERPGSSA